MAACFLLRGFGSPPRPVRDKNYQGFHVARDKTVVVSWRGSAGSGASLDAVVAGFDDCSVLARALARVLAQALARAQVSLARELARALTPRMLARTLVRMLAWERAWARLPTFGRWRRLRSVGVLSLERALS